MGIRKKKETAGHKKAAGKKLAAAAAAAVVLTAGAAVHERFQPDELVRGPEPLPAAAAFEPADMTGQDVIAELPEEERKLSRADGVRARLIRLPAWVKSALLLPLWAIGSLPAALAPALGLAGDALLRLIVQLGVLTGLFCLVYKLLFPGHKIRELFRKKNLRWLLLGAAALTAADMVLGLLWEDWNAVRTVLMLALSFGVLWLLWRRLCGAFRAPEPETVRERLVADQAA